MTEAQMKACSKCKTDKPVSEYHLYRSSKDGRNGACKPCRAEWYARTREATLAQQIEYKSANPHIGWEARYRRRCRDYGVPPVVRSFTREDMLTHWNNGPFCIYCDTAWSEIEHLIPVGLGGIHAVENVTPSCGPCNRVNAWTVVRERRAMAAA